MTVDARLAGKAYFCAVVQSQFGQTHESNHLDAGSRTQLGLLIDCLCLPVIFKLNISGQRSNSADRGPVRVYAGPPCQKISQRRPAGISTMTSASFPRPTPMH